jgi:D-alanyl-lipoteichoic acid acyltransferase DltB (MBOAT superfamily)
MEVSTPMLNVILPVGISFYTFQSLSYTLDVYRKKLEPTKDLTAFLAYVSFFPQLVAGPIERASNLLPQFLTERKLTKQSMEIGVWLVIWGMFKKVVLADNFGALSDMIYGDQGVEGSIVYLGTIAFGFQIYCDFSGYSDIARGLAYMMGFNLMVNFNLPYFATSPSDFWRRWHISLSTWFRDYLYIPLGGNRGGNSTMMRNLLITMLVAGLWHGAGWNFVLWGLWHGVMLCLFSCITLPKKLQPVLGWFLTMIVVFYGWLLFRAQSMSQIMDLTASLFDWSFPAWISSYVLNLVVFMAPLLAMQVWQYRTNTIFPMLPHNRVVKSGLMAICVIMTAVFWNAKGTPFIYFQF